MEGKGNRARMGALGRRENQEKRGQLDLQEWLFSKVLRETRGKMGSAAYSETEDRKVSEVILGLLAPQE